MNDDYFCLQVTISGVSTTHASRRKLFELIYEAHEEATLCFPSPQNLQVLFLVRVTHCLGIKHFTIFF